MVLIQAISAVRADGSSHKPLRQDPHSGHRLCQTAILPMRNSDIVVYIWGAGARAQLRWGQLFHLWFL